MSASKMQSLQLQLPNKPGELQKALTTVGAAGVDLLGYCGWTEGPSSGQLILVPSDGVKAGAALEKAGYKFSRHDVVVVRESNVVGQGAKLAGKIAKSGVNLNLAIATATGQEYITIYAADNVDALLAALK